MNKKIAIPAIAVFAVTLGIGLMAPALADNPHTKVLLCHAAAEENINNGTHWLNSTSGAVVIEVDNKGKMNGHFDKNDVSRHHNGTDGDWVIEDLADIELCGPEPILTITPIV
ncbi:MAG: hypothetical protein R3237_01915 [Nitrosopumilaceae archaeon]|nr:hypothetical protein [Nitrosopumilaceae archaeon]